MAGGKGVIPRDGVPTMKGLQRRALDDGWDLRVMDEGTRVIVDYALTLATSDGYTFRVEQPLVFIDASATEHLVTPEGDPTLLAVVLPLARTIITEARAFDDGRLELDFGDGSMIRVACGDDFEPWQATGPVGLKVVAVPGGELAIWR